MKALNYQIQIQLDFLLKLLLANQEQEIKNTNPIFSQSPKKVMKMEQFFSFGMELGCGNEEEKSWLVERVEVKGVRCMKYHEKKSARRSFPPHPILVGSSVSLV